MNLEINYTPKFFKNLDKIPESLKIQFIKKIQKIKGETRSKKHLKHKLPYFVEKINKSARIVYKLENNKLTFINCFKNHKDYEKWYKDK